jgi:hypothetical protein
MRLDNVIGTFLKDLENQEDYDPPVPEGRYLGFYIPGGAVVLKRIEQLIQGEPPAVAYSVLQLLEPRSVYKKI